MSLEMGLVKGRGSSRNGEGKKDWVWGGLDEGPVTKSVQPQIQTSIVVKVQYFLKYKSAQPAALLQAHQKMRWEWK
jgi:hypothetical protein